MKAAITQKLLRTLKPASKPFEVWDTDLAGLVLRVQPSGVMTYYAEYGRHKRYRIGRHPAITIDMARTRAKELMGQAAAGKDPMEEKRQKRKEDTAPTLRQFLSTQYGPWVEAHRKDGKATRARLMACFDDDLGDRKLAEITPWLVEKWRTARLRVVKPATVNRDMNALRALLSRAVEWGALEAHPLSKKVKRLKAEDDERVRFLSDEEEERLRKALDEREERIRQERDSANRWRRVRHYAELPDLRDVTFADHLKPMVLVSINTGVRQGELFSLQWDNLDLGRGILTVRADRAKAAKTRHIPLNVEAFDTLRAWREQRDNDGLVFPNGCVPPDLHRWGRF